MYRVEILAESSGYTKSSYIIFVPYYFLQVPQAQNLNIMLWPQIITLDVGYDFLLQFYEEISTSHLLCYMSSCDLLAELQS
jgi:hypothetical protein